MATAEQIKSLIRDHLERDDEKFKTTVLQIAAYEAKKRHTKLARDIKELLDKVGTSKSKIIQLNNQNQMLHMSMPNHRLSDLIVSDEIYGRIKKILNEFINRNKLYKHGLSNRKKILLEGNPGTGKTLTASIIASELNIPLYTVQMDKLVTKFLGERVSSFAKYLTRLIIIQGYIYLMNLMQLGLIEQLIMRLVK